MPETGPAQGPEGQEQQGLPYWPLSIFYFTYFALLGATFPYWSLYLESIGFEPFQIGLLLSVPMVTKIIAPTLWGWIADKTGQPLKVIRIGALLAFFSFALVFLGEVTWLLAVVIFLYSFFWNAVLPQQEVITLAFLRDKPEFYSRIRVWGSMGFIATVTLCGAWFEWRGVGSFLLISWLLLGSIWLASLNIPPVKIAAHHEVDAHFLQVCRRPAILSFLVAGLLLQVSHGVYYSFYSIYLESLGHSRLEIGLFWSIGVISEVVIFIFIHTYLKKLGVRFILLVSLMIAFVRWLIIGHFGTVDMLLVIAQVAHAFTYGAYHAAAIESIRRLFPKGHQGRGQAVYSGISFGLGGAIGSVMGGYIWKYSPAYSYDFAALASLLAFMVLFIWLRDGKLSVAEN